MITFVSETIKKTKEMSEQKFSHGGPRAGAGRKPDPDKRVLLSCRVAQPTLHTLKGTAKDTGQGIGAVLDFIISEYQRRVEAE